MNTVDKEENKFVLIINAQGQHVLALQSEIRDAPLEKEGGNLEFQVDSSNRSPRSRPWDTDDLDPIKLKEPSDTIEKTQSDNEKMSVKNTNDLLSLMMSRLENSVSSSTFELEHLRVSSPKQKESLMDSYADFPQISDNAQMNIVDSGVEQSLARDKDVSDSLQTINVESLKELLYSIDRK